MQTPAAVKRIIVGLTLAGAAVFSIAALPTAMVAAPPPAVALVLDTVQAGSSSNPAETVRYQIGWWCKGGGKTVFINQYEQFAKSRVFFWRTVYGMYSCLDGIK